MDNMAIYNAFRNTPATALKPILEGKLKGKSDINPMWRIEKLTEQFGPIGIGWNYKVTRLERVEVPQTQEVMCFVDIELYYKHGEAWSEPLFGTGGSMLVDNFRNAGVKANDDGFKMALTDAISVACKQLGMAADVYWAAGETKYSRLVPEAKPPVQTKPLTRKQRIDEVCQKHGVTFNLFGALLAEMQQAGQVSAAKTGAMTDPDFDAMLKAVDEAMSATRVTA